ncbi:hypothetical protein PPSIR1_25306 [Plesiocystis pacifica SIR-1]|uniref:Phage tail protein n=1 Tax=Plesiocystis pacifica SIR-1 TaxID=391625 RepID=A6FZ75_9BACT|nr:phage tail protein [Plesiocystis pacifica]EDM80959.1 hypothetical protein PPSIR1_25306 [Plesiocystis pacifica SIR-1]
MAQGVEQQLGSYPLPAYNFRVVVDGQSMAFTKVGGLQREHQSVIYQHGLSDFEGPTFIKYFRDKYVDLSFDRGVAPGSAQWLYDWLESDDARSMEIDLLDAAGEVVVRWTVAKAFVVKVGAPSFDASTGEVAVDNVTVKAAGIQVKEKTD